MTLYGTVVNGLVVFNGSVKFPEGSEVVVALADEGIDARLPTDETFEYPHPLAPYDREKEIALLRSRAAGSKAGVRPIPLDDAMTRIAAGLDLSPTDAE